VIVAFVKTVVVEMYPVSVFGIPISSVATRFGCASGKENYNNRDYGDQSLHSFAPFV
jgi:hypothetical protein